MKTKADIINYLAIILCVSSATIAAATNRTPVSRICCALSAFIAIVGIILKLREWRDSNA